MPRPTLFCLHGLGMTAREFDDMADRLADEMDVVALDLPGHGGTPAVGITVEEMTNGVLDAVRARGATTWMLLGHSMGGKIATLAAARVLRGEPGLFGLRGLVLLAPSPLEPEPLDEERRERMIGWAADGSLSADEAELFLTDNVAVPLPPAVHERTLRGILETDAEAWTAWLERGARQDWSDDAPTLPVPALVLAGAEDGDLGVQTQRTLTLPRFPTHRFGVVEHAAHLLALEQPDEVAERIRAFWRDLASRGPEVPARWAATIASHRTSSRTRGILATRALPDDPEYAPQVLSAQQLAALRALAHEIVPQGDGAVDLAARIDAQLARGEGDGWRPGALPPDIDAYRAGLDALAALPALDAEAAQSLLEDVALGRGPAGALTPQQLAAWFEDACVDLARQWVAHPATSALIDYDGFANGGDGARIEGFQLLAEGSREQWEPPAPTALLDPQVVHS